MRPTLRLALLGDSIAWGQGAREEDRLAARLAHGLSEAGHPTTTGVFAVPGARSAGLAAQVDRAVAWRPDLCVVVVGANDLTHGTPPDAAVADLGDAVRRLRAAGSEVVLAPAPDLSSVPRVPVALRAAVRVVSEELRRRQADVAAHLGAVVADLDGGTADAFASDRALFSADRFHPSSAGYAVIAAALLPSVLEVVDRRSG